ncbi:hypothetical protein BD769DRAFT_1575674 [Suillus cothurnatus]|nr:hypothetical protein BD769DRAFT_1575674 [Suillus cothurnatus]
MPDLKDQLHAVWLCFEIPRAGGRLLETGAEHFLALKRSGKLGNIPFVVVFTKYDKLFDRVDRTLDESSVKGLSSNAIGELIKNKADAELKETCIGPLENFAGLDVPYATVSTKKEHAETLARLIQITEDHVCKHVATEASVMTSIAQRVDPRLKFKASIEVGKRRYLRALTSYPAFPDRRLRDWLRVLHFDIVAVWNFSDPHGYLYSDDFRKLMVNMINKLDVGPTTKTIGAAFQRFTAYVVDLTLVFQTLCLVLDGQGLSRRAIKLAVTSYHASPTSGNVHNWIQEYNRTLTLRQRADRDSLDRIIELMESCRINAEEIFAVRAQIPTVGSAPDEPW